jgi:hypothetical protein
MILGYRYGIAGEVSRQIREGISAITIAVSQILSRLESQNQGSHDIELRSRSAILKQICQRENLQHHISQEITAGIEMLSVSDGVEQRVRKSVQMTILRRLGYAEMTNRYEDVVEAHPETFEWAFSVPAEQQAWSDLSGWLKEGSGVYWVSGKAGSGKSTFMKHLVDDKQKRLYQLLRIWAAENSTLYCHIPFLE